MLEALIIALREGLEAALALGIILLYIRRVGRAELNRYVFAGLTLAIIASLLGAGIVQSLGLEPENEIMEGTIMAVGAVFVGSMVVWTMKTARNIRGQLEQRIESMITRRNLVLQGLGLMAFSFILVFREGIETILFLAAMSLRIAGNPTLNLVGGITGLLLAATFGVLIFKGMVRVNLRLFFAGTGAILLVLVASLIANAIHEFSEVGLLPSSPLELSLIGLLVREETSILILVALTALPILMIVLDTLKPSSKGEGAKETSAHRRMRIAGERRARIWKLGVGIVAFVVILTLGSVWSSASAQGYDPNPAMLTATDGRVTIPLNQLTEGTISKFSYQAGTGIVRVLVIAQGEGAPKVALDVCYICPAKGYYQAGEELICKNCGAPINIDTVGMAGGCNPRVLNFSLTDSEIVLETGDLEEAAKLFS